MAESIAQRLAGTYVKTEDFRKLWEALRLDLVEIRETVNHHSTKNGENNTRLNAASGISGVDLSTATVTTLNVKP